MTYTITIHGTPIKTGSFYNCLAWLRDNFGNVTLAQALDAGVRIEVMR